MPLSPVVYSIFMIINIIIKVFLPFLIIEKIYIIIFLVIEKLSIPHLIFLYVYMWVICAFISCLIFISIYRQSFVMLYCACSLRFNLLILKSIGYIWLILIYFLLFVYIFFCVIQRLIHIFFYWYDCVYSSVLNCRFLYRW